MIPGRDRRRLRREVREEMEHYLRERTDELIREGVDPDEARRRAEAAFGDVGSLSEACVEIRRQGEGGPRVRLETLLREVRVALRGLARRPGFALAAMGTLALGIGANVALFSLVRPVLLEPLPFPAAEELVQLWESDRERPTRGPSPANFLDVRREAESFQALAAYDWIPATLDGGDRPLRITAASVSSNFFHLFRVPPLHGPGMVPGDASGVVLSHSLWEARFGGDPGVVGTTVRLDGAAHPVLGVMPPGFAFPGGVELWVAAPRDVPVSPYFSGDITPVRDVWYFRVVGRLRPGVGPAAAREELAALARGLEEAHPGPNDGLGIRAVPLQEELAGPVRGPLLLLLGATGLVLLVACVNVGNLLLVRGAGRRREVAIRRALGAGGGTLAFQVALESLVLAVGGGGVGCLLAWGVVTGAGGRMSALLPVGMEASLDGAVLAYAAAVAVGASALFGLLPALLARSTGPGAALSGSPRGATGAPGVQRTGRGLVAAEVALAVVLVLGATLLLRSLVALRGVELGVETEGVTVASVAHPDPREGSREERAAFFQEVEEALAVRPGIRDVAVSQVGPLESGPGASLRTPDRVAEGVPGMDLPDARWQVVTPDYFRTLGIPLLQGRDFLDGDRRETEAVGILNQTAARLVFGDQDPVGRLVNMGLDGRTPEGEWRWVRVVGVVADVRNQGPAHPAAPTLFRPLAQGGPGFSGESAVVVVRGGGAADIREAVAAVAAGAPVYQLRTGAELVRPFTGEPELLLGLLSAFAVLALVLGAVGIYGVTAFAVEGRTREVGVRMALGAGGGQVVRLVVAQALRPVLVGVLVGVGAALAGGSVLQGVLFGVTPRDPASVAAVAVLLSAVGGVACWLPARRASRLDPATTLRQE